MNRLTNIHDSSLFLSKGVTISMTLHVAMGGYVLTAAGFVTKALLKESDCRVWAFEPFPGNVPYFQKNIGDNPRVTFYQAALGSFQGAGTFYVSRVVDGNQPGWSAMHGYSSEGYLVPSEFKVSKGQSFTVNVLRLEDLIDEDVEVTLLKLDLQGGEYDALVGLSSKIATVHYAYVEFSLDWRTLEYFLHNGFVLFDSPYTGIPKVGVQEATELFDSPKIINLSNGFQAISGVVRDLPRDVHGYRNFLETFKQKYFHHLWSDLIAVNELHLRSFFATALQ